MLFSLLAANFLYPDFFLLLISVSSMALVVIYPIFLIVCLPLHGIFLKKQKFGFNRYLLLSLPFGAMTPIVISLFVEPHIAQKLLGIGTILISVFVGATTTTIFWLITMWRNSYYTEQI